MCIYIYILICYINLCHIIQGQEGLTNVNQPTVQISAKICKPKLIESKSSKDDDSDIHPSGLSVLVGPLSVETLSTYLINLAPETVTQNMELRCVTLCAGQTPIGD